MTHCLIVVQKPPAKRFGADGAWLTALDAIAEKIKTVSGVERLAENVWKLPLAAGEICGATLSQSIADAGLQKRILICAEAPQAIVDQWTIP